MHAAHRSAASGIGVVNLHDRMPPASRCQLLGAEQTCEKAAAVPESLALNPRQAMQGKMINEETAHQSTPEGLYVGQA
jgi:hypothetical protein